MSEYQPNRTRRAVLKAVGIGAATLTGTAGLATANDANANGGGGKQSLEDDSSLVAALNYGGYRTHFPPLSEPEPAFFDPGLQFDTTTPEVVANGRMIHYRLPFGTSKPYVLRHEGGGVYTPRGAVTNFESDGSNPPELPKGRYRATVREKLHLYEKGGYFDWSVTRADFFSRPGMAYVGSSLIIVWDEVGNKDGDDSESSGFRTENPDLESDTPEFSEDVLGDDYDEIETVATELIEAGVSNPGGN